MATHGDLYHYYQGFRFELIPEYEDDESRLARGDWKCRIIGWSAWGQMPIGKNAWRRMKNPTSVYESQEAAIAAVEGGIDAIIDSL